MQAGRGLWSYIKAAAAKVAASAVKTEAGSQAQAGSREGIFKEDANL
jgi:hypothetical protein